VNVTLVIEAKDGQLHVHGPIANTILCYGLLEAARDIVHAHAAQAARDAQPRVVPATVLPPNGQGRI
jgi:hypothetical protein